MPDPYSAATTAVALGAGLGLGAGLAPGPLTALVLAQALRYGTGEGLKVAIAPLLTDVPIVTVTVLLLANLASGTRALAALGAVGGGYLIVLAADMLRAGPPSPDDATDAAHSLRRGAVANALNPHPWVFWGTVGGPYLLRSSAEGLLAPAGFVLGFYGLLVGSKAGIALAAGRYRHALRGRGHVLVMRALAVLLLAFGVMLLLDAARVLRVT